MSEEIVSEVGRFALPFLGLSEKGRTPFTPDMELAAVFSVAEINRRKGGRLILRRSQEKIAFIAKLGYPLWLYPFSNNVLLFDGLNVSDYYMPYAHIPHVKAFVDGLKSSSNTRETYSAFLSAHSGYFAKPATEESFQLKGLISDSRFLGELDMYRREAKKIGNQPEYTGLLSSPIDESRLFSITHDMAGWHSSFEKDVKSLNASIQLLGKAAHTFLKELHDNVKVVRAEFALKIKEEEDIVTPQINALRVQYDKKIIELARNFECQQLPLNTQKLKLEKSKVEIKEEIKQYSLDATAVAESGDAADRQIWKQKIKDAKQKLSAIEDQLKDREKALEDFEKKRAFDASRLKSELEAGIKEARKNIVELEASRDARILVARQEMDKLEKQTKLVSDQIGRTVKLREANVAQFEKLCMKPYSEELNKALVYVPFYAICYDSGTDKRYLVLPPSFVSTIDISTKLKGAFGRARIRSFLAPRFKEITSLSETIQEQSQKNSIFETELKGLGVENNILAVSSIQEEIGKGLLNLKNQGWLSDKDYGAIVASAKINLNLNV